MSKGLSSSLYRGMIVVVALGLTGGTGFGQALTIGSDTSKVGEDIQLPLTLDSKDPVQGLTVILEWDADAAVGKDFDYEPVVEKGDTVVERIEKGFFVLGVVMDSDGKDNEVIPAGQDILLGTLILQCQGDEGSSPVRFVDGKHASVAGGPLLDNVIVVAGESIGDAEGLDLENGSFQCEEVVVAQPTLKVGSDTSKVGGNIELPLTLDTKDAVQGLTVVLEWDADSAVGKDFDPEPVIEKADMVVERIEDGFLVLGVVMDTDGKDNEMIAPGEDILLGTLILECVGDEGSTPVRFVDGKHASVDGGPVLDNVVVIEGESIGDEEGLNLENGSFECEEVVVARPTLKVGSDTSKVGENIELPLTLDSKDPVEGLTVVLEWNAGKGEGKDFDPEPILELADTVVERVEKGFFVLGVVMDTDGKDNEVIPPGQNIRLGTLILECKSDGGSNPVRFVDGKHASVDGGPLLDNVVVIEGESIGEEEGLNLDDGSFTCEEEPQPGDEIEVDIDVRPGSCPNNVNIRSHGKLEFAILGSDDLDVDDIQNSSVRIEGARAIDAKERDVAGGDRDEDDDHCECERSGKDGINDLVFRINTQDLVRELLEDDDDLERGDCVTVTVTGRLEDGTRFRGEDVVRILGMQKVEHGKGRDDDDDDDGNGNGGNGNGGGRHDLNRDGIHDVKDVLLRVRLLFEQPHELGGRQANDIDGDGEVNAQDAVSDIRLLFE